MYWKKNRKIKNNFFKNKQRNKGDVGWEFLKRWERSSVWCWWARN